MMDYLNSSPLDGVHVLTRFSAKGFVRFCFSFP